jgi:hypothetical protein
MPYKSLSANHCRGTMGQDQPLALSEEKKNELSIGLLRGWWLTATQAFVEQASSETALRAMLPYLLHSGMAGASNLMKDLGIDRKDSIGLFSVLHSGNHMMNRVNIFSCRLTSDGGVYSDTGCLTMGASPEACLCF